MFATVHPQPSRKSTTKKVSQRVKPKPTAKAEYRAEPVSSQERQHYEFAFSKWLKENASQEVVKVYSALWAISLYAQHGIGPNGHTDVRRARNVLKKHLSKFKPEK